MIVPITPIDIGGNLSLRVSSMRRPICRKLPDSRIRNVLPFNQVAVKLIRAYHAERHNRVTVLGRKRDEAKADHLREKKPRYNGVYLISLGQILGPVYNGSNPFKASIT